MFKTKSDVDKYVGKVIQQKKLYAKGSQEGLKIARAYFDLKEFDTSINYLASYLSENSDDAQAWRLMGELNELHTKNWSQALDCFIKYYELNTQATHVLLKICNCLNNLNTNNNENDNDDNVKLDCALEWLDKAEKFYPFSKEVLELKEKLFNKNLKNMSKTEWESYLRQACVSAQLTYSFIPYIFSLSFKLHLKE
jgi:tetratricopeptide (TPR) repeat protein